MSFPPKRGHLRCQGPGKVVTTPPTTSSAPGCWPSLLMGGTGGRRVGHGPGIASAATAALPPFTAALALELAPVRVNLIAAGFVDTPLSASLLGDQLEERRNELRATLPIGRVVAPPTSPRSPSTS